MGLGGVQNFILGKVEPRIGMVHIESGLGRVTVSDYFVTYRVVWKGLKTQAS